MNKWRKNKEGPIVKSRRPFVKIRDKASAARHIATSLLFDFFFSCVVELALALSFTSDILALKPGWQLRFLIVVRNSWFLTTIMNVVVVGW